MITPMCGETFCNAPDITTDKTIQKIWGGILLLSVGHDSDPNSDMKPFSLLTLVHQLCIFVETIWKKDTDTYAHLQVLQLTAPRFAYSLPPVTWKVKHLHLGWKITLEIDKKILVNPNCYHLHRRQGVHYFQCPSSYIVIANTQKNSNPWYRKSTRSCCKQLKTNRPNFCFLMAFIGVQCANVLLAHIWPQKTDLKNQTV